MSTSYVAISRLWVSGTCTSCGARCGFAGPIRDAKGASAFSIYQERHPLEAGLLPEIGRDDLLDGRHV
ncbi:MAG TPA: hypothetical protein VGP82_20965 [Ktedonobacterales bacterium]|jgi:hypothetical protein|nr:hypothetical protein [Ktedonobacterales bacterium]